MTSKRKRSRKGGNGSRILLILIPVGIVVVLGFFLFQHQFGPRVVSRMGTRAPDETDRKKEVLLYFSDTEGEYLVGEKRRITKKGRVEEEGQEVVAELIEGPRGNLVATIPRQTKLVAFRLDDEGTARLDFNRSFSKNHPGGSSAEIMTTYSIVNSLALNFPQIKRVQILVEGTMIETISGHLSLRRPIAPKPDLVKKSGPPADPADAAGESAD